MNSISFFEMTTFSLPLTHPILPSHSNHQLERLFIDLLLPSASSSPSSTPVSFISCALPPLVSRAVGQRERDVTGTENVRKWGTREVRSTCRNELRRQPRQHEKDWQRKQRRMESASLRLHACMWEVRACTRVVKLDKARKKLKRHSFKGSSFQSVTENVQQQGHFF